MAKAKTTKAKKPAKKEEEITEAIPEKEEIKAEEIKVADKFKGEYISADELLRYVPQRTKRATFQNEHNPELPSYGGYAPGGIFVYKQVGRKGSRPYWAIAGIVNDTLEVYSYTSKRRMSGIARQVRNILRASEVRNHPLISSNLFIIPLEKYEEIPNDCQVIRGIQNTLPPPTNEERIQDYLDKLNRGRLTPESRVRITEELLKLGVDIQGESLDNIDISQFQKDSIPPENIPE